jgi:hypothetical protein
MTQLSNNSVRRLSRMLRAYEAAEGGGSADRRPVALQGADKRTFRVALGDAPDKVVVKGGTCYVGLSRFDVDDWTETLTATSEIIVNITSGTPVIEAVTEDETPEDQTQYYQLAAVTVESGQVTTIERQHDGGTIIWPSSSPPIVPSYGLVGEDFVTGDVVTVTPCTAEGEEIEDEGEVDVYLKWDGASVDLSKDPDGNAINCVLPAGSVISYFKSADGFANAITEPSCVVTRVLYSTPGIMTLHRWVLAGTQTIEGTEPVERIPFYDITAHQVQWDNTNKKLQYRTVTFTSPIPATEGAWTDMLEFECLSADTINSLTGSTGGGSYE